MLKKSLLIAVMAVAFSSASMAQVAVDRVTDLNAGKEHIPVGSKVSGGTLSGTTVSGAELTLPSGELVSNVVIKDAIVDANGFIVAGNVESGVLPLYTVAGGTAAAGAGVLTAGAQIGGFLAVAVGSVAGAVASANSAVSH